MARRGKAGNFNLGNWLLGLGCGLLLTTFYVPFASAARSSRVERRGDEIAAALLAVGVAQQPLEWHDPALPERVFARTVALASATGGFAADLRLVQPDAAEAPDQGALIWLANKHYLFQLAAVPPDPLQAPPEPAVPPLLEVLAWPLEAFGPAHTAFYYPEGGEPAYSRNLQRNYHGVDARHRPLPGAASRRDTLISRRDHSYRGHDDERWILRDRSR